MSNVVVGSQATPTPPVSASGLIGAQQTTGVYMPSTSQSWSNLRLPFFTQGLPIVQKHVYSTDLVKLMYFYLNTPYGLRLYTMGYHHD